MPFIGRSAKGRDGGVKGRGVIAADVQPVAERDRLAHAGMPSQLFRQLVQVRPAHRPGRETRLRDDLRDGTVREQASVGDIRHPVTSFSFVQFNFL